MKPRRVFSFDRAATPWIVRSRGRERILRGGRVFAVLEGRARAENDASKRSVVEASAVRAAVRGAMKRIPEALE